MRKIITLILGFLLLLTFVYAASVGVSDSDFTEGKVIYVAPESPINYSLIPTVNSSDYWDALDTPADISAGDLGDGDFGATVIQCGSYYDTSGNRIWEDVGSGIMETDFSIQSSQGATFSGAFHGEDSFYTNTDNKGYYAGASNDVYFGFDGSDGLIDATTGTPNLYFTDFTEYIFDSNIIVSGNITANIGTFIDLNVTGTLTAGDLVWDGNLDMGGNNITNIDWINGFNQINGSGNITTTGTVTAPTFQAALAADVLSIHPDAVGDGTAMDYGSGIGIEYFKNAVTGTNPSKRLYGFKSRGATGLKYVDEYMDEWGQHVYSGTAATTLFKTPLSVDNFLSFYGTYVGWFNRNTATGGSPFLTHMTFGGYSSNNNPSVWVMTEYERRNLDFDVPADTVAMWLHDGSATAGNRLELKHDGTDSVIHSKAGDLVLNSSTGLTTTEGNFTAENVWIPQYIFSHNNATIPVVSAGVWVNITFDEGASLSQGITHTYNDATNDTFTITETGVYEFNYELDFEDSATNPDSNVVYRVINNNVEIDGSVWEVDLDKKDWDSVNVGFCMESLTAGDEIKLQFTSDDTTVSIQTGCTYGDHCDSVQISIKRIG